MDFLEMCCCDPRLQALYEEVRALDGDPQEEVFCAEALFLGEPPYERRSIKRKLMALVGWHTNPEMEPIVFRGSGDYAVAYHALYEALPMCRGRCRCGG